MPPPSRHGGLGSVVTSGRGEQTRGMGGAAGLLETANSNLPVMRLSDDMTQLLRLHCEDRMGAGSGGGGGQPGVGGGSEDGTRMHVGAGPGSGSDERATAPPLSRRLGDSGPDSGLMDSFKRHADALMDSVELGLDDFGGLMRTIMAVSDPGAEEPEFTFSPAAES
jgi:hypothetical protein